MDDTVTSPSRADITPFIGLAVLVGLVGIAWAAPSSYEIYKVLHVLAAVVWVGGGVLLTILALLTQRANDPVALANIGRQAEFVGTRIFIPSSVIVLVFGIAMIEKGELGWGHFWIDAALVGWAITFVAGAGFFGPQTKRLNALVEEHGVEHPIVQSKLNQILTVARLDIAMLLLVVADMTAKPFA
jgi:uncharacterized membrane protein